VPAYSLTDDGNALRLVDDWQAYARYVPERGQWLTWDAWRWKWDHAGRIQEAARTVARHRLSEASSNGELAWAHKSHGHSRIRAMISLAATDQRVVAGVDSLDAEPYDLNTPAGIVDLRTGALRRPDPDRLHTRGTLVAPAESYDPHSAPHWERFLADTFAGQPDVATYLQRVLGQAIIGTVLEQILPFAYGSGANGKTTAMGVVQRLVGIGESGYSINVGADLLLAQAHAPHPTEIAQLAGQRLVVTSEVEDGQRFAEAKVKMLTGRDVISGRFMRQDFFSFRPTHTLFLLANHQPQVKTGGDAFFRRMALIPFLHTVPVEARDPELEDRLVHDEGPQILRWLISGAVDYLRHGLAVPEGVRAATAAYAADQDTVGRFVEQCCDLGPPGQQTYAMPSAKLRGAYEKWCADGGEQPVSAKALTQSVVSRFGVQQIHNRRWRGLDGIRLKWSVEDDQEALP
jgi:putative DNA primase/helicase